MTEARCTVDTYSGIIYDMDIELHPSHSFIFIDIIPLWMNSQVETDYLIAVF